MATATQPEPATRPITTASLPDQRQELHRLTLDQYHRIAEAGILTPRDRVVLLDGILVKKMTKGDPHTAGVYLLYEAIRAVLPVGFMVRKEDPVVLRGGPTGGDSMPEPDIAVVRGGIRDYAARKPEAADIRLVVEVADSSLYEDRKGLARYAWAGIPVAWIVNLRNRTVEAYTDPTGPGDDPRYRSVATIAEDGQLSLAVGGRDCGPIAVRDILP